MISNEDVKLSNLSYTDKDFASIYPDLLDLAKNLTNKWDPSLSNESDPGVVLLKEGAFISDHNNYNIDKNVLESFLPSATQDISVRNIVETNGYVPQYYISATGNINFSYKGSIEYAFSLPAFSIVISNDSGDVTYTQIEDLKINKGVQSSCLFMEGTLTDLEVNTSKVIKLENLDDNLRIYFPHRYIAENGIYIKSATLDEDYWERNNYLLTQPIGSKIYKFDFDSILNLPYVEFPTDIANLIGDGLSIKYFTTSGADGNISARTLNTIVSPDEFTLDGTTDVVSKDDFTLLNNGSITNGKDPETIAEMYNSFKRIVGTFDTLVTTKDYTNSIYTLTDKYNNSIISNGVVTDRRNDYNNSLNVITFDKYGEYFKNISFTKGITKFIFDNQPINGHIKYDTTDNKFKIYGDNKWNEISEISYKDFVTASETMSPYDLCIYALKSFTMNDYNSDNKPQALNNSFTKADYVTYQSIKSKLLDKNCINHTFKDPSSGDIICFKNYVPLYVTITPYSKVTKEERNSIIDNVYRQISQKFNSRMVEFGNDLDYDEVVKALLYSDDRIKNIRLENLDYTTYALMGDGTEKKLIDSENSELLIDLISKNVLAGRLCLFDFGDNFSYQYGENLPDGSTDPLINDIQSITTEFKLYVDKVTENIITNKDTVESVSFNGTVNINIESSQIKNISIQPFNSYSLLDGEVLNIGNNQYSLNIGGYSKVELYNNSNNIIQFTTKTPFTIEGNNVCVRLTTTSEVKESSPSLQYTINDNEYVQIGYNNYYAKVTYPAYCYYRYNCIKSGGNTIPANINYKLTSDDTIIIVYSENNVQQQVIYSEGDIIRTNFDLSNFTGSEIGVKKVWKDDKLVSHDDIFVSLTSSEQISQMEPYTTVLTGINTPCYWIRNNVGNVLFDVNETETFLDSGEYFIYTNDTKEVYSIFGNGTKLTRAKSGEKWSIDLNANAESINTNGINAVTNWVTNIDFSNNNLTLNEMTIITLGKNNNIKISNWPDSSGDYLDNTWKKCGGPIVYQIDNDITTLDSSNVGGYYVRSRLDLTLTSGKSQELKTEKKTVSGEEKTVKEQLVYYSTSEEEDKKIEKCNISSNVDLDIIGGNNISFKSIINNENDQINFIKFSKSDVILKSKKSSESTWKESVLTGSDNKFIVNFESSNEYEIKLPFIYLNTKHIILPIYLYEDSVLDLSLKLYDNNGNIISEPDATEENKKFKLIDFNISDSVISNITNNEMYLLEVVPIGEVPTMNINLVIKNNLSTNSGVLVIYNPVVFDDLNKNLKILPTITLDSIKSKMKNLVGNSDCPQLKPYYIHTPGKELAMQSDEMSDPTIMWDKNNIANIITIPQVDLSKDATNIDIIKSMRNY